MITFLRRAAADAKGASAVEFALILPFLFLLHIGSAEALQAYVAHRNVAHVAATMADITARNRTVSTADLNDILAAGVTVMHPFPNVGLQQRISSLSANASGTVARDWTVNKGYIQSDAPSVPPGYLLANESVIVTDVIYEYRPTFGMFLPDTIRMTRHSYVRPRLSAKVEKVD
jgi:Flp pilus assembly protein TadG